MDIAYIKSGVYILSAKKHEFDTHCLTEKDTVTALCSTLHLYSLPENTLIELYEGSDNIMIFAHIPPSYYSFDNFEDVVDACSECTADSSSLYFYDGKYILSVPLPNAFLDEFAAKIHSANGLSEFLNEHGKLLIDNDAVNFVKNTF